MAKRRKPRPAKGSLFTIAVLLIGSSALRIGTSATEVTARQMEPEEITQHPLESCVSAQGLEETLALFQTREKRLKSRELALENRLAALQTVEVQATARLAELEAAEDALRSTISAARTAAEDDVAQLVKVYESMKPKDAAALFEAMDPAFAAGFLARMKPAAAAGIFAGLSPHAAYSVSAVLAGRNNEVPTE